MLFKNAARHGDPDGDIEGRHAHLLRREHANDWFHFNQPARAQPAARRLIKGTRQRCDARGTPSHPVTLFRVLMITYYVDNTTTAGTPRLTRVSITARRPDAICRFTPQALAGVVEDLDLTYDLVDVVNPTGHQSALHGHVAGVTTPRIRSGRSTFTSACGRRLISKPTQDYVRNHISTSVDVRSLASVDRYMTRNEQAARRSLYAPARTNAASP